MYIDVDKFAEKICNFQAIDEDSANAMIWLLRTFPAADVVEVVRCKDCKHYGGVVYGGVCRKYSGYENKVCTEKDHYCSYGERKEG